MRLDMSTWPQVEAYLARSTGIIIPVGSIEQHGPTGLIGTDALCPQIIAQAAADQIDTLIAPTFQVGIAPHHMGFAGTLSLRRETMIAALQDWADSLAHHGFTHLYFLNGHGGNIGTLDAAVRQIHSALPSVKCLARSWWMGSRTVALRKALYPVGEGGHATPSEIAITQAIYPHTADSRQLDPPIAPVGKYKDAASYRAAFPDGRLGSDPSLANGQDGRKLIDTAVTDVVEDYTAFLAS